MILQKCNLSIGQFLNAMTLTWLKGHDDADHLMLFTISAIDRVECQDGSPLLADQSFLSKMESEMIYDHFLHLTLF